MVHVAFLGAAKTSRHRMGDVLSMLVAERGIERLLGAYCRAMDDHDVAAWVTCFATEGRFEVLLPSGATYATAAGAVQLHDFITNYCANASPSRHYYLNPLIEVTGDGGSAQVQTTFIMLASTDGTASLSSFGSCADLMVCAAGQWKILKRQIRTEGF